MTEKIHTKSEGEEKKELRDVVCGMNLFGEKDCPILDWSDRQFSFCGKGCRERFLGNPEKFQGEPLIKIRDLHKVFHLGLIEVPVLRGIDINIWEGDFVSIIGASGSGKSTVLNLVGLLDRPTSGSIYYKGKDISSFSDEERAQFRSQTFGFVFQQYNLIPWLTAYENASLPIIFAGRRGLLEKLGGVAEMLGLTERLSHRPFELSGGEQQRVALLRALANDPTVILGDEPTGNLDSKTGDNILKVLTELNRKEKKTLVIVTHDAGIAEMADEIITIKDGRVLRDNYLHRKIYATS